VEPGFEGSARPSTPAEHPWCTGVGDADADAPDAEDGGDDRGDDRGDADVRPDGTYCTNSTDCTDGNVCNGVETCDEAGHVCVDGERPADGSPCGYPAPGRCRDELCIPYSCGDGWLDGWRGEECDDGNLAGGDGCEGDCRTTCVAGEPCHEEPDDPCTADSCVALDPPEHGRLCRHEPAPEGEVCDYADTDCDGTVDEGMTREARGMLRFTTSAEPSLEPSLAWNTANYLLAWIETAGTNGALWARGVTADGAFRGSAHRIDTAGSAHGPALAWTPSAWALAWRDTRRGDGTVDVRLALLDTAGVLFGDERLLTGADARAAGTPALVWDGLGIGVAWSDERLGDGTLSEIWFRRAAADATPEGDGEVRVTEAPGPSREPALAWTGASYALAWIDGRDAAAGEEQIRFVALDSAGAPLGGEKALTTEAREARDLRLAWTGTELGVAWTDRRGGTDQAYFLRVAADGEALGAESPLTAAAGGADGPSVVWTGAEWGVAWREAAAPEDSRIVAAWLASAGGAVVGQTVVAAEPGESRAASLAWAGAGYGLAWVDGRDGNEEIWFALVGCPP
jgi:cysteine-rich repeat protein